MAKTIHGIFRSDAMLATSASAGLRSAKYFVGEDFADIDNGCVVKLEALMEGERELWKAVAPAADSDIATVFVVGTPEVMYDERLRNLTDFYNEAGVAIRCYPMHSHDEFAVTAPVLDGAESAVVGSTVGLQDSNHLKVGATGVGKITYIEDVVGIRYFIITVD